MRNATCGRDSDQGDGVPDHPHGGRNSPMDRFRNAALKRIEQTPLGRPTGRGMSRTTHAAKRRHGPEGRQTIRAGSTPRRTTTRSGSGYGRTTSRSTASWVRAGGTPSTVCILPTSRARSMRTPARACASSSPTAPLTAAGSSRRSGSAPTSSWSIRLLTSIGRESRAERTLAPNTGGTLFLPQIPKAFSFRCSADLQVRSGWQA